MSDLGRIRRKKTKKSSTGYTYCIDLEWQGKKHQFSKYGGKHRCETLQMAEALRRDINREIEMGIFNPLKYRKSSPLLVREYFKIWIKAQALEWGTEYDYRNSFNNHIIPVIGDEYITDLNKAKLQDLMKKIKREPKGKKNVMSALKTMMRDAWQSGHIQQMPFFPEFKGKNKIVEKEIVWMSEENQWNVTNKIPEKHKPIFIFMKLTGCRPSEARAFRKTDIKDDHIIIAKTFGRAKKGKGEELKDVKSKKARAFPLTDALRQLFADSPVYLSEFRFPNPTTKRPYSKNINKIWNKAVKDAGLEYVSLNNSMRHSMGCQLLNNHHADMEVVRRLLGHTTTKMTQRYAQHSTEALGEVLNNVQKIR